MTWVWKQQKIQWWEFVINMSSEIYFSISRLNCSFKALKWMVSQGLSNYKSLILLGVFLQLKVRKSKSPKNLNFIIKIKSHNKIVKKSVKRKFLIRKRYRYPLMDRAITLDACFDKIISLVFILNLDPS